MGRCDALAPSCTARQSTVLDFAAAAVDRGRKLTASISTAEGALRGKQR